MTTGCGACWPWPRESMGWLSAALTASAHHSCGGVAERRPDGCGGSGGIAGVGLETSGRTGTNGAAALESIPAPGEDRELISQASGLGPAGRLKGARPPNTKADGRPKQWSTKGVRK